MTGRSSGLEMIVAGQTQQVVYLCDPFNILDCSFPEKVLQWINKLISFTDAGAAMESSTILPDYPRGAPAPAHSNKFSSD